MLLVFLMAAMVAISLYVEIPRVAFEAQRQKEQLLISRGEQYKRAIQVFQRENKRWPAKIEELETMNNKRYLRKRFIDPMTGKNEWRMIHVQNGVLIDSLVTKAPNVNGQQQAADTYQWGASSIAAPETGTGGVQGVNLANRKRGSDSAVLAAPGDGQPVDPNNPQAQNPGVQGGQVYPGMPGQPGNTMGQTGTTTGQIQPGIVLPPGIVPPGVPGQMQQGQYPGQGQPYPVSLGQMPVQSGQYPYQGAQPYPGQPVQYPGQMPPNPGQAPPYPGQPVNSQIGGVSPYSAAPGANGNPPGFPQQGNPANPAQQASQAQNLIQQILTSPRPGGLNGVAGQQPMAMGGGIAGVASNADSEGIKVYNDHTNYKEWEFIFDPMKVKPTPNPMADAGSTPASQLGSPPGGSQIGTPVTQMPGATGFGSNPQGGSSGSGLPGSSPPVPGRQY